MPVQHLAGRYRPEKEGPHEWEVAATFALAAVPKVEAGTTHNIAASPTCLICLPQSAFAIV